MGSFKVKILIAVFAAILLHIVSCTPESCLEGTIAYFKAPLYRTSDEKNIAPDSLTLYGLNMEADKIYDKAKGIKLALMPLNPSADSCGFVMTINDVTDTILIWYASFPHLISQECGYTFFHTLDSLIVTYHAIDSVIIRNRFVTTINEENIRILY